MQTEVISYDEHIEQGSIGRHETFAPRYGWLKKGYDAVKADSAIFKATDAIERLGVGKNMVSSIRFWCTAFHIIESSPEGNGLMKTTQLGERLLDDNGWDPYLEDIASLWLLHWQLFVPRLETINWPLAFNKCNVWSFDIKQLSKILYTATQKYPRFAKVSESTFEKDASCIIRMYAEEILEKESEIDCPFTQLGIIRNAEEKNEVSFSNTEKQTLPPLIFAAASFSYISSYVPASQRTISLQRLTYDFNSPGVAFKLPETVVGFYLYSALKHLERVSLRDDMGTQQLHFDQDPKSLFWLSLEKYYKEK